MKRFQYEITKHTSDKFNELVYFCSDQGDCSLDQISEDQTGMLSRVLNEKGGQGWELVQLVFGKEGVVAFWRRRPSDFFWTGNQEQLLITIEVNSIKPRRRGMNGKG